MCYPKLNTAGNSLGKTPNDFVHDFGAPVHLTFDSHESQVGKKTQFFKIYDNKIDHHISACSCHPSKNPMEGTIHEIKWRFYTTMKQLGVSKKLWDYLIIWIVRHLTFLFQALLPQGGEGELINALVRSRALDANGNLIGKESLNPITNTRMYEVEFIDGTTETVAANVIAENLLSKVESRRPQAASHR